MPDPTQRRESCQSDHDTGTVTERLPSPSSTFRLVDSDPSHGHNGSRPALVRLADGTGPAGPPGPGAGSKLERSFPNVPRLLMPASESVCGGLKIFVTSSHEKVTVRVTRAVMPGRGRRGAAGGGGPAFGGSVTVVTGTSATAALLFGPLPDSEPIQAAASCQAHCHGTGCAGGIA